MSQTTKAPGLDYVEPKFIFHVRVIMKLRLRDFLFSCQRPTQGNYPQAELINPSGTERAIVLSLFSESCARSREQGS